MTRKLASVVGGVVLTGGLLAGGAGIAGAAPGGAEAAKDCPSGYFCVWSGKNYTGHRQQVAGDNKDLTKYTVFRAFKSYYNHGSSCDFLGYSGKNHSGSPWLARKGAKDSLSGSGFWYTKSNKWTNCR
ncbi:peptidase inhibitor family I36 protein [Streptomyces huiliensis]|uniref:peptidase inhibitor family I36 protein n=1 Tax=Streptomyces huiliensis TaxID=2876027 RepID=UPI001CC0EF2B|nr:peptidase inhibitor family I36 protein [Streptomyces huiliensis]